jgi:membrane dipeptidase
VVFVPKFTDADEEKATLERVADHIEYIGERCGRSHVGISSDFGTLFPFFFPLYRSYQMV